MRRTGRNQMMWPLVHADRRLMMDKESANSLNTVRAEAYDN